MKEGDKMARRPYIGVDLAAGKDMTVYVVQQDAQKPGKGQELDVKLIKATEQIEEAFKNVMDKLICPAIEYLKEYFRKYFGDVDKWELEKLKMPNNKRRRCGIPMVRRRAHIRNANRRKRSRRK